MTDTLAVLAPFVWLLVGMPVGWLLSVGAAELLRRDRW